MIPSREKRWIVAGLLMSQFIIVVIALIMALMQRAPDRMVKPTIFRFQPIEPFTPLYHDQRDA